MKIPHEVDEHTDLRSLADTIHMAIEFGKQNIKGEKQLNVESITLPNGDIAIKCTLAPVGEILDYVLVPDRIFAPNPKNYQGQNGLHAIVQNIHDVFSLLYLAYDQQFSVYRV